MEDASFSDHMLLWPSQQVFHLTSVTFISAKRLISSSMGVSSSACGSNPTKTSSQCGLGSFSGSCQDRGMLKRRKRCNQFLDHLVFELKDFSYNTLCLHLLFPSEMEAMESMEPWKDQKEVKG